MTTIEIIATSDCPTCENTVGPICPKCRGNMIVEAEDINEDGWISEDEIHTAKWRCISCDQATSGVCPLCRCPIGKPTKAPPGPEKPAKKK